MKRFTAVLLMLAVFAGCASAEVIGTLTRSNVDLNNTMISGGAYSASDTFSRSILSQIIDPRIAVPETMLKFYDSFAMMQMALNRGEVYAVSVPEIVGEYALRQNPEYTLRGFVIGKIPFALSFGFLEDKEDLCKRFSQAIKEMSREGRINAFQRDFITGPAAIAGKYSAVKFEEFADAESITVAVTGDLPPLDYAAEDGEPAGFNTAILAEIGRRLHVNIKTVTVETGARAAALQSGRADVVFWFQVSGGGGKQEDVPEGVITSVPYFGWNKTILLGKK